MTSWSAERPPCLSEIFHRRVWLQRTLISGARLVFLLVAVSLPTSILAHVAVPESVLNPQSASECWNVLRLAMVNIERLVHEDRLAEVPDQASLCSPALRMLAKLAETTAQQRAVAIGTVQAASAVNSLAQACVAGDRASVVRTLAKLHAALDVLATGTDPQVLNADIFFCPMHPDVISADAKAVCPKCGMTLTPRRIPYSFVYAPPPGEQSLRLTAVCDVPPTAGRPTHVTIRLATRDGSPVRETDLLVAHTRRIHLLIIDPALEDYHHEHPTPTGTPGEYEFAFTPAKTASYRIYADVVPAATGVQEYIRTELPGAATLNARDLFLANRQSTFTAEAGGLHFQLCCGTSNELPLHAGQPSALRVQVTDARGLPFAQLEPVMNAFAHLVGFYDDDRTVVHLHPAGPEVVDPASRGGPSLEFRFYPPKDGFLRLYCQVSVGGKMLFVPFSLNVVP